MTIEELTDEIARMTPNQRKACNKLIEAEILRLGMWKHKQPDEILALICDPSLDEILPTADFIGTVYYAQCN